MTAVAIRCSPVTALSLPRIGAWSASLTIHLVALALLLSAPVAYQLVNRAQKEEPTVVDLIVEKPVPVMDGPLPPPPMVHHEKHAAHPAPTVADPVPTTERTAVSTDSTATVTPPAIDATPSQPAQPDTEPTAIAYGSHASVPYPHESLKGREQGTVMLLVLVGVDGKVEDIRIDKSSGYARLDRAARDAVKLWNFNPARHGGIAQRAWAKVPINFTLSML
jgi:protein TonB